MKLQANPDQAHRNPETIIYTIGHSNLFDHQFIKLLQDHGITVLVDVRSSPHSQYVPQFNREILKFSLLSAGIDYNFLGDKLGGRPSDPTCYYDQALPDGEANYLHLVDYPAVMTKSFFLAGIEQLNQCIEQHKQYDETDCIALMCSEEDPNLCHRHHLVGKYLMQLGFTVLHIRKNGLPINARQLPSLPKRSSVEQLDLFG